MISKRDVSLSVVIPSYKSMATLELCLDSVLNQSIEEPYEVILVDSSDAATQKIIENKFKEINLIKLEEKANPARARNIGVRCSKGQIIAVIDSDCIAESNWLEIIAKTHRKAPHLIIGGSIKNYKKWNIFGSVIHLIEFGEFLPGSPRRTVSFIPTGNASYKRAAFDKYGLFPIEMDCSEDVLFHHKIAHNGNTILFTPQIKVSHINRKDWKDCLNQIFKIGLWTAVARRKVTYLSGSFLVRFRFLIPLLFFYKFTAVLGRVLRWDTKNFPFVVFISPLIAVGVLVWVYGFWKGAVSPYHMRRSEKMA